MALLNAQQTDTEFERFNVPDEGGYLRVPYDFCKSAKRTSDCLVQAMIYSFSCVKGQPDARCAMSYTRMQDKLHYARSTVNAAIRHALGKGTFDQDKSSRFRATYKYLPAEEEGCASALPSFTVDFYMLHTQFIGKDGTARYLPKSAAMVLGLIKTHHENGGFSGSDRKIARTLGYTPKTVRKALNLLIGLGLIFRPAENRGINASKLSSYIPNGKALRKAQRAFNKEMRGASKSAAKTPEEIRIERDRYYSRLQAAERDRVESLEKELNADSRYFELDRRRRQLEIETAKAEIFAPLRLPGLQEELGRVIVDRARRMAQLGFSEDDLKPKFLCVKCEDTGYCKSDGKPCDCFRRRGRS